MCTLRNTFSFITKRLVQPHKVSNVKQNKKINSKNDSNYLLEPGLGLLHMRNMPSITRIPQNHLLQIRILWFKFYNINKLHNNEKKYPKASLKQKVKFSLNSRITPRDFSKICNVP